MAEASLSYECVGGTKHDRPYEHAMRYHDLAWKNLSPTAMRTGPTAFVQIGHCIAS